MRWRKWCQDVITLAELQIPHRYKPEQCGEKYQHRNCIISLMLGWKDLIVVANSVLETCKERCTRHWSL